MSVDLDCNSSLVFVSAVTAVLERNSKEILSPFDCVVGREWDIKNKTAIEFVNSIEEKFRKKNKIHGTFKYPTLNPTPKDFIKYLNKEISFSTLIERLVLSLKKEANSSERKGLHGGNLIFIHYKLRAELNDFGRFLTVMVNKRSAFDFDDELQPKKLNPIDTDALRQAASFDMGLLSSGYPEGDGKSYLHFIESASKSDFFKVALGCDDVVTNKESVAQLYEALKSFVVAHKLERCIRDKIIDDVEAHLVKVSKKKNKSDRIVRLDDIQKILDRALPLENTAIGKFSEFVNEYGYAINEVFEPTRYNSNKGVKITLTDDNNNYECGVKLSSIGYEGSEKTIQVDSSLDYIRLPLSSEGRKKIGSWLTSGDDSE